MKHRSEMLIMLNRHGGIKRTERKPVDRGVDSYPAIETALSVGAGVGRPRADGEADGRLQRKKENRKRGSTKRRQATIIGGQSKTIEPNG